MNSMFILHRCPVVGFNWTDRLELADKQSPQADSCFHTHAMNKGICQQNLAKIAGCFPVVCIGIGIMRIYNAYEVSCQPPIQNPPHARYIEDLEWMIRKQVALGVAEICHLSVVLAIIHVAATVFDYVIVVTSPLYKHEVVILK